MTIALTVRFAAAPFALVVLASLGSALGGCKDQGKVSAQKAGEDVSSLAKLADTDVAEIERGLPEGAKRLTSLWVPAPGKTADPHDDLSAVRTALVKVRRDVPDLNVSKSTFFAVADDKGVAIRNNLEQDAMAGQNLLSVFPDLTKAKDGYAVTTGAFAGTSTPQQADKDWIAAAPIKGEDGKVVGLYVTGWTFRRFAFHLQESLRHDLSEKLRAEGDTGKLPVFYVAVFDRSGVYGAPKTPSVNEKALADADLVGKTAQGPHQASLNIADRDFGYGAIRTPKLGPETGIVVLRSEL